jgi:dienelactone hydrolase
LRFHLYKTTSHPILQQRIMPSNALLRTAASLALIQAGAAPGHPDAKLYQTMADAYRSYDVAAVTQLYTRDAVTGELDSSNAPKIAFGRDAIRANFARNFEAHRRRGETIDIAFRIPDSRTEAGKTVDRGIYRFTTLVDGRPTSQSFGRFVLVYGRDGGLPSISGDFSAASSLSEFEDAPGPVIPVDELLAPSYYDALLGDYLGSNGCRYLLTRSTKHLFLTDSCAQTIVGLDRLSGLLWEAGETLAPAPPYRAQVRFERQGTGISAIELTQPSARPIVAIHGPPPRMEDVTFTSADGTRLAGTVRTPDTPGKHPAVVIIHGSGDQDRHGYASIIDVIGERFLRHGFVVLQYDKRGSGASLGDWRSASFATLAQDAEAGRELLMHYPGVDATLVGLAGSSQAGWIAAKAVTAHPLVPFVALLGAAGTAMTVEEQNSYNARVQMHCAGISEQLIGQVLAQQDLFYRTKADPSRAVELRRVTELLAKNQEIAPWLLPAAVERANPAAWYVALETSFDPRAVWAAYRGQALFAHGMLDDATPTAVVIDRLRKYHNSNIAIVTSAKAQHLGLLASDVCHAEPQFVSHFDPAIWGPIGEWAAKIAARASRL